MEALNLIDFEPSDPKDDFKCGNSMFSDILWDFNGCFDTQSSSISRRFKINFEHFEHKGEILDVAKWYMVYELLYKKFSTAKRNFDGLIRFIKFVDKHHLYGNL